MISDYTQTFQKQKCLHLLMVQKLTNWGEKDQFCFQRLKQHAQRWGAFFSNNQTLPHTNIAVSGSAITKLGGPCITSY